MATDETMRELNERLTAVEMALGGADMKAVDTRIGAIEVALSGRLEAHDEQFTHMSNALERMNKLLNDHDVGQ